jgi:hypothetical protein
MTPRRRARAIAAGAAVLAAVAVWLARGGAGAPTAVASLPARASLGSTPAPVVDPPATASAPAAAPARPHPTAAARRPALPPNLARTTADDYRRRARFPRHSHPLADDEPDPIARDREVTPVKARGPNGEEPTLLVFPAATGFEAPGPVVLHAMLSHGDHPVPARSIRGLVMTEDLRPLGEIEYLDTGVAPDALGADGIYTAVFDPGAESEDRLAASYLVQVRALTIGEEERLAAGSFLYSRPHAQLTGAFRDTLVDGSLAIDAEVDVLAAGRFHVEATLYSADGSRKLVWAQAAAQLEPGQHWLRVPFYGLGLREAGTDGPYLVRYVALSTTSAMPNAKNRVQENAHLTAAYRAGAFTDQPYNDPVLIDAADRLEHDTVARGLEAGG